MTLTAYIGTVAAFCTTVAFVPQIVKLRKQGGEDLSYQMLGLYLTGVLLWLVYGIRVHAVAVIWANALAGLMVLISIILKANPPAKKLGLGSRNFGSRDMKTVSLPILSLLRAAGRRCSNCRATTMSTSPVLQWKSLTHSTRSMIGCRRISPSFPPARLCSAGTRTLSTRTSW